MCCMHVAMGFRRARFIQVTFSMLTPSALTTEPEPESSSRDTLGNQEQIKYLLRWIVIESTSTYKTSTYLCEQLQINPCQPALGDSDIETGFSP
jgi:hypothetical protein